MNMKCPKCKEPFLPGSTHCVCGWRKKKNSAPYHAVYFFLGKPGETKNIEAAEEELQKMKRVVNQ